MSEDWRDMPCEEWRGRLHSQGYGVFSEHGQDVYVHRRTWEECYGPIPEGMHVLHHCDNRKCRQPLHLFLGTHLDNIADMNAKGRGRTPNAGKTHCKRGHAFTPENTHFTRLGRGCRECRRTHSIKQAAKRKAARRALRCQN